MIKRYCVNVLVGEYYQNEKITFRDYKSYYFDKYFLARNFRNKMIKVNKEVTEVMDLENLPF